MKLSSSLCRKTVWAALPLLFWSVPAWGLQTHGGPEGLYVHQGAHILFIIALISFAVRLRLSRMLLHKEWRRMYTGTLLLALWNIWAFAGHIITLLLPDDAMSAVEGQKVPLLFISSWQEVAYYILKMDHLLSLPAVLYFLLGLQAMQNKFPRKFSPGDRRKRDRRVYF